MSTYKVEIEFIALVEQMKAQIAQTTEGLKGLEGAAGAAGGAGAAAGDSIFTGMLKAQAVIEGVKLATKALWEGLEALVGQGIKFNSMMETAQLGIASLISAQSKLTDEAGRELKGREALNAALVLSQDQMQKLKIAGLETVATTEQLVVAYQQALGVGLSVGMNLDEVRQITIKITQAAAALGVPMNQLAEEVRDLLQGNINPRNTRIATALQITNEEVRRWQAAGGHTLADELNKRMEAFGFAGEKAALTWSGVTSNVVEAIQTMSGAATEPLFSRVKEGLQNALKDAFDLKNARISDAFSGLVDAGRDAFGVVGELADQALNGAVEGAKQLSAWFKENRKDVFLLMADAKEVVVQFAKLVGQIFVINKDLNQTVGLFDMIRTLVEGIGLIIAVVRDAVDLLVGGAVAVVNLLLKGVAGPIQVILLGIEAAMNAVKKGSGDAVGNAAQKMQDFLDKGDAYARGIEQKFETGKNAVAQFGDALLDAREKAKRLGEEVAQAADPKAKPNITPKPKDKEAEDRSGVISAMEIEARLAAIRVSSEEKITLEQQKQRALDQAKREYLQEAARIEKEAREGKFDGNQAGVDALWAANLQRRKDREAVIEREFADKRTAMEADLQARLTAGEEGGLQQRLEAVRKTFDKMRQEAKFLRTAQMTDADMAAKMEGISRAEQAAKDRARQDQVRADLGKLKQELAELAQVKGHALSIGEMEEVFARFAAKSKEAAEAVRKLREELHLDGAASQGWFAGIKDWVAQAGNAFQTFKQMATSAMGGVEQAFSRGISGLLSRQMTLGQAMKAVWQGIAQTVIQSVAQIVARWAALAIAKKILGLQENAEDGSRTAASLVAATAETWAAYAGIPVLGQAMALAQIATMYASMATSTGMATAAGAKVTAMAVGGMVESPTLALLAEAGEPEVVAPRRSFMDWAKHLFGMGANLQANVDRNDRIVTGYTSQGAGFAAGGAASAREAAERGPDTMSLQLSFPGAQIWDQSDRGKEAFGNWAMDAIQVAARRRGQVIVPGSAGASF